MTKKNNKYKVLFIKNNGLDMKEISFSKIISFLSVLAVFIFTIVIVSIFSSDLVILVQKSQDAFTETKTSIPSVFPNICEKCYTTYIAILWFGEN